MLGSIIGAVGSLASGFFGNREANRQRDATAYQAENADARINGYIQDYRASNPYFSLSQPAAGRVAGLLGLGGGDMTRDLQRTPGYQFRLGEGINALEQSAVSRGGLLSGKAAKDITRFGQDYGTNNYQQMLGNYTNLLDRGNQAGAGILNAATGNATNTANMMTNSENTASQGRSVATGGMINGLLGSANSYFGNEGW